MNSSQITLILIEAATPILLTGLIGVLRGLRRDIKKFQAEHLWLLAMGQWTARNMPEIFRQLGLPFDPPPDWPRR